MRYTSLWKTEDHFCLRGFLDSQGLPAEILFLFLLLFFSVNFLPLTFPIRLGPIVGWPKYVLDLLLADPTTSTCLPFKLNSLCSNYLVCSTLTFQLVQVHCYQDEIFLSSHRILLVIKKVRAGSNLFTCVTIEDETTGRERQSQLHKLKSYIDRNY